MLCLPYSLFSCILFFYFFFFFQAEDGIRDTSVTGVQTCALPISNISTGNTARGDAVVKALALLYHDVVDAGDWDASGFPDPVSATYKLDRHDFARHLEVASAVAARRGPVHDLLDVIPGPPRVLLTFDDGGGSRGGGPGRAVHLGTHGSLPGRGRLPRRRALRPAARRPCRRGRCARVRRPRRPLAPALVVESQEGGQSRGRRSLPGALAAGA